MSGVRYSIDFLIKSIEKGSNLKATGSVSIFKLNASFFFGFFHVNFWWICHPREPIRVVNDDSIFIAMNESLLQYASKTVLQCSGFIFFSHWHIPLLLYSNIQISVLSMFAVNDQNQNRQQSCSKKSKCLLLSNISSVRQNLLRWYQLCNWILRIEKKKKLLNNWVIKKKALKNVAKTGHGVSQKKLKLVNMPFDMELHQLWDISHRNIQ